MSEAKQTAMDAYGFTEWPGTHTRTPGAVDCRAYACVLMEKEGLSRKQISAEIGFSYGGSVSNAIKKYSEQPINEECRVLVGRLRKMAQWRFDA